MPDIWYPANYLPDIWRTDIRPNQYPVQPELALSYFPLDLLKKALDETDIL